MVPQTLASGAKITLKYSKDSSEKEITANIDGQVWATGKKYTYTLKSKSNEPHYIYFDVALGDVKINSETYSGKIWVQNPSSGKKKYKK